MDKTRKFASATTGDPNDQPHPGVTFTVYDDADVEVTSGTTDDEGLVRFDGLAFGDVCTIYIDP